MSALLVADVGGTNARFGLMQKASSGDTYTISEFRSLKCDDFASLADMVRAYCETLQSPTPAYACFAAAGPVKNDEIQMTNRNWFCSGAELSRELNFSVVKLLNDFAALAHATRHLSPENTVTLHEAGADPQATIAVMGPGTGFGVAALIPNAYGGQVLPSEGGHVGFAPETELEIELLKVWLTTSRHVSVEDLLSGPGLVKLYRSLAQVSGVTPRFERPDQISLRGFSGEDSLCRETLTLFCNLLGAVAGDKALDFCACGGVYIGGGITPRFDGFLQHTDFLTRFQNKGPMSELVARIPIRLIKTDNAALIGCAAWLENFVGDFSSR